MTAHYKTKTSTGGIRWMDRAACAGRDIVLFFGDDGERQPDREIREWCATEVCSICPVRTDCLDYAITSDQRSGVWGGLTEDERASERRRRMRQANAA